MAREAAAKIQLWKERRRRINDGDGTGTPTKTTTTTTTTTTTSLLRFLLTAIILALALDVMTYPATLVSEELSSMILLTINDDLTNTTKTTTLQQKQQQQQQQHQQQQHQPRPNKWTKTIAPGQHANIPPPQSRNITNTNGERIFVHDPNFVHNQHYPMTINTNDSTTISSRLCSPPGSGLEGPEGNAALQRIRKHIELQKQQNPNTNNNNTNNGNDESNSNRKRERDDIKLFCAVYTHAPGGIKFTNAIRETWAKRCDGTLFASSESNLETGHTHLPSNSSSGFGYNGMTQRTRTILAYLYDNFLDEYDYFHLSGDDTYLIVENLKEFLQTTRQWEEEVRPDGVENYLFAGFQFSWARKKDDHLGGGSGYTLSAKALKAFVEGPLQNCDITKDVPNEDMYVSTCFHRYLNEARQWIDTRDDTGAHRYHQISVQQMASMEPSTKDWLEKVIIESMNRYSIRNGPPGAVFQEASIADSSVAFHKHSDPNFLRRYELLLYGSPDLKMECKS